MGDSFSRPTKLDYSLWRRYHNVEGGMIRVISWGDTFEFEARYIINTRSTNIDLIYIKMNDWTRRKEIRSNMSMENVE